jgi:hypothetical protein
MALPTLARLPRLPTSFDDWLLTEIGKARLKLAELERKHPGATKEELGQRLIDTKKNIASTGGAVAGLFGLAAIPADLALVAYLELALVVELAVLFGVNLKTQTGKDELLEVLGFEQGSLGPIYRAAPLIAGKLSTALLAKLGRQALGRAVPVVAVPLTAYINNRDIQKVGEGAIRTFGKFRQRRITEAPVDAA